MSAYQPIRQCEANTKGRDFAVGDVHGCFDQLQRGLDALKFDPQIDRLFSVGDLVDRGAQSHLALEWLSKPWFMSVRGNHEQMAIDCVAGMFDRSNYAANGGAWFMALERDEQKRFAQAFSELPIAIEVETQNGKVGIVHADCPVREWSDLDVALTGENSGGYENLCLWSRERITHNDERAVAGIHAVIVGHTPVRQSTSVGNVIYIDTGAVFTGNMAFLNLGDLTVIEMRAKA